MYVYTGMPVIPQRGTLNEMLKSRRDIFHFGTILALSLEVTLMPSVEGNVYWSSA